MLPNQRSAISLPLTCHISCNGHTRSLHRLSLIVFTRVSRTPYCLGFPTFLVAPPHSSSWPLNITECPNIQFSPFYSWHVFTWLTLALVIEWWAWLPSMWRTLRGLKCALDFKCHPQGDDSQVCISSPAPSRELQTQIPNGSPDSSTWVSSKDHLLNIRNGDAYAPPHPPPPRTQPKKKKIWLRS